jgi:hypothetical protein
MYPQETVQKDRRVLKEIFRSFLDLSPKARRYLATELWMREKILDRHEDPDYDDIVKAYGDL